MSVTAAAALKLNYGCRLDHRRAPAVVLASQLQPVTIGLTPPAVPVYSSAGVVRVTSNEPVIDRGNGTRVQDSASSPPPSRAMDSEPTQMPVTHVPSPPLPASSRAALGGASVVTAAPLPPTANPDNAGTFVALDTHRRTASRTSSTSLSSSHDAYAIVGPRHLDSDTGPRDRHGHGYNTTLGSLQADTGSASRGYQVEVPPPGAIRHLMEMFATGHSGGANYGSRSHASGHGASDHGVRRSMPETASEFSVRASGLSRSNRLTDLGGRDDEMPSLPIPSQAPIPRRSHGNLLGSRVDHATSTPIPMARGGRVLPTSTGSSGIATTATSSVTRRSVAGSTATRGPGTRIRQAVAWLPESSAAGERPDVVELAPPPGRRRSRLRGDPDRSGCKSIPHWQL